MVAEVATSVVVGCSETLFAVYRETDMAAEPPPELLAGIFTDVMVKVL